MKPWEPLPDLSNVRRLIVFHQGALGDFLLARPVFEALHRRLGRGLRLDFWSKPQHVALLASRPYTGGVISGDGPSLVPFFHEDLWREAPLPAGSEAADAVLIFGQDGSRAPARRLGARLKVPVAWIRSFPRQGESRHVTDDLFEQMERLGWNLDAAPSRLEPPSEAREVVREWLTRRRPAQSLPPIILHPGSGGVRKIWPQANWWRLLLWLRETSVYPVILTLGPADETLEPLAVAAEKRGAVVVRSPSLSWLSALLAEAHGYVGNDSGVSHLAAAVGIRSVVVFGPTDPAVWRPRGSHVTVVRRHWTREEALSWVPSLPPALPDPEVCAAVREWERDGAAFDRPQCC